MRLTNRKKVSFGIAAVLAVGSLVTSVGSYVVSKQSIRNSIITNELPLTGDSVYSEIQRDLLRPVFVSDQMAHDTFLRDWYQAGETDEQPIRRYLTEIKERFHATTSFFVSERTRNYYHPSGIVQQVDETDPGDAWYFRVRSMSAPYEINVDTDRANKQTTTVFINFRMLDANNKYLGVTGVGLTLESINQVVADYETRFRRHIYFVNEQGETVLDTTKTSRTTDGLKDSPGIASIADQILAGRNKPVSASFDSNGSTTHLNTRYIAELKWFLIVEENEDDAVQPLQTVLIWNLLIGTFVTALVVTGLTVTLNRYQRRLEHQATTDSLTEIANRRKGEELLAASMQSAHKSRRNENELLSALLIDIDHFKKVNDEHGHLTGDEVIKEVVKQTQKAIRSTDHLIRWGGEEFLVILPNCHTTQAQRIGQSILDLVAIQHHDTNTELPPVTVSIGIATAERNEPRHTYLARLDKALYQAKTAGRNQTQTQTRTANHAS
jgi:diguanylate cyclase (GGDEF)-like protein